MADNYYHIKIIEKTIERENIQGVYPQISLSNNRRKESRINGLITGAVDNLINKEVKDRGNLGIGYDIKLNKRGLLSIVFEAYSLKEEKEVIFTSVEAVNLDVRHGDLLYLDDIFDEDSYYEYIIDKIVNDFIETNDTPLIQEFSNLKRNKCFYLTEDSLVSYIPLYRDTGYANFYCTPEFSIPLKKLKGLISPKSPVAKLIYFNNNKYY